MPTKDQLERALRRADAAGNMDDARALANALKAGNFDTPQESKPESATEAQKDMVDLPSRIGRGAMDPITGLAQMVYEAVPESVQQAGTKVDQWLYDKTGGFIGSEVPFDEKVQQEEQQYQQARQATGQEGVDWARLGGNVASTVPLALMGPQFAAASMPARVGAGAAYGGAFGTAQPAYGDGDFWEQKGQQAATGAVFGGASAPIGGMVARMIRPKTSTQTQTLMREGVTPTPGQILGGPLRAAEEKARSMPILGDMITAGQNRSISELNRAVYNRALAPIGKSADDFPIGREGVARVKEELSNAYQRILPKLTFQADDQFLSEAGKIREMVSVLPEPELRQFNRILSQKLMGNMTSSGRMSGESFKKVESELRRLAKNYMRDQSADKQQLGQALDEVVRSMRNNLSRMNPDYADELQAINKGYANYAVLRNAASRAGAEEGFTPSQLAQASKAMDRTVGKGGTATGNAPMQDLSDAGKSTLAATVPDSGTPGRMFLNAAAMGSGYINPLIPVGLGAGGLPYTPAGQRLASALLTKRPGFAEPLANAVRQSSPAVAAPFALQNQ